MPDDILWSEHFMPTVTRGLDPSPFIVCYDFSIYHFQLTFEPDGTPIQIGPWETRSFPSLSPDVYGRASCMTEMPGSEFGNGLPRLFIGTEDGFIIVLQQDNRKVQN